jgi:lipopolysaccharide export system permease protein
VERLRIAGCAAGGAGDTATDEAPMILQRYIGWNVVKGWLLVFVVLTAVFGLISFTEELDHIELNYNTAAVARFTLLSLPNQMVSLAPVIALIGCIVALANMDRYRELTIVSCTGFPLSKLLVALAIPTALFMALLWACMEYVTPPLQTEAEQGRQLLRESNPGWIPGGGVWSTDGLRYLHLGTMSEENVPGYISLFTFDSSGQLARAVWAETAKVSKDRRWLFQGVKEKVRVNNDLETRVYDELEIDNLWSSDELPTLTQHGDSMSLTVLYRYSKYLAKNHQPTKKFLNMFWQRVLMPLTVGAMVLLAMTVSARINAGRDRSFGLSLGIGALLGISFYLGTQIVYSLGELLQWSIPLIALMPTLVILTCAVFMLRRMRW